MSNFQKTRTRVYKGRKMRACSHEMLDFIRANTAEMTDRELSGAVNRRFNLSITRERVKSIRLFYRIMKGRDKIKVPPLTERTDERGYALIYTPEGKRVSKHRFLYEQAHGKVPKGSQVIFLDGDKYNFSLDNLAAVTRAENAMLTGFGLRSGDPALTQTGIAAVRLKNKINARMKTMQIGRAHV